MDGSGLAGPVRPGAVDLTRSNRDVDPVDRSRALLVLADEPLDLDPVVVAPPSNTSGGQSALRAARGGASPRRPASHRAGRRRRRSRSGGTSRRSRPTSHPTPEAELALALQLAEEEGVRPSTRKSVPSLLLNAVHEHPERTHHVGQEPARVLRDASSGTFIEWQSVRTFLFLAQFAISPSHRMRRNSRQLPLRVDLHARDLLARRGTLDRVHLPYRRHKRARFEDGAGCTVRRSSSSHGRRSRWSCSSSSERSSSSSCRGSRNVPSAGASRQLEITVTGRQYYWQFEYPNGVIAIDTMRAPAGVPSASRSRRPTRTSSTRGGSQRSGARSTPSPERRTRPGSRPRETRGLLGPVRRALRARARADARLGRGDVRSRVHGLARTAPRRADAGEGELGKEEWEGVCAKCHGLSGEGGIAPRIAGSHRPRRPAAVEDLVRNGRRAMPAVGSGGPRADRCLTTTCGNPPSGG